MRAHERGAVTIEAAFALAAIVAVVAVLLLGIATSIDHIRCVDAAREAARVAAQGDWEAGKRAGARVAPAGARVEIERRGEFVVGKVTARGRLPSLHISVEAVAVPEPEQSGEVPTPLDEAHSASP